MTPNFFSGGGQCAQLEFNRSFLLGCLEMEKCCAVCLMAAFITFHLVSGNTEDSLNIIPTTSTEQTLKFSTRRIPASVDCACVPFYQCINGTHDKHGINQITYKSIKEDIQSNLLPKPCPEFHTWCCNEPYKPADGKFPPKSVDNTQTPPQISHDRDKEASNSSRKTTECGYRQRTMTFQYKIIGKNNEAQPKEFPWTVMITTKDGINPKLLRYLCGGSLIHERVVLTAAHCAAKIGQRTAVIVAGEHDTRVEEQDPNQERPVTKIITHPAYDDDTLHNDIALLVTDEPFIFAPNVNILCLPKEEDVILDSDCLVAGWGKDMEGDSHQVLKKTTLPIVPRDVCQLRLREIEEVGADFELHESFVCAGGVERKDTCQGDGGSPLICPIKGKIDRYQQVGIVAWGIKCGEALPAVYVNVARFRSWIDGEMKKLNFITE
uniref:Phenoloxidase-activating factor 2 n=2 Tax=Lygus hesperus TaxID=30085 RepID=A0A146M6H5_LYGHE